MTTQEKIRIELDAIDAAIIVKVMNTLKCNCGKGVCGLINNAYANYLAEVRRVMTMEQIIACDDEIKLTQILFESGIKN